MQSSFFWLFSFLFRHTARIVLWQFSPFLVWYLSRVTERDPSYNEIRRRRKKSTSTRYEVRRTKYETKCGYEKTKEGRGVRGRRTRYEYIRRTRYEVRDTTYDVRVKGAKYDIRGTTYEVRSTKYETSTTTRTKGGREVRGRRTSTSTYEVRGTTYEVRATNPIHKSRANNGY